MSIRPDPPPPVPRRPVAEAWDIGDSFAGDTFSDDGNPLCPSEGRPPTRVGRESRSRASARTIALFLPVAISSLLLGCGADDGARRRPPTFAKVPGVASVSTTRGRAAAPDVASRFHRRDLRQGPND
jgi:hypothetical protein